MRPALELMSFALPLSQQRCVLAIKKPAHCLTGWLFFMFRLELRLYSSAGCMRIASVMIINRMAAFFHRSDFFAFHFGLIQLSGLNQRPGAVNLRRQLVI